MNWRKPFITGLLSISGSKVLENLKEIKKLEKLPGKELLSFQEQKLKNILLHAWKHIPYYRDMLEEKKVVFENQVYLENFTDLPILTKDIIRSFFENIQSQDTERTSRKPFLNTSGGSTGQPVKFIQDKAYSDWNIANKIYYKTFADHEMGEKEMRLWGSERDLMIGKEKTSIRLRNWLYNRYELNAFTMTSEKMEEYVSFLNQQKPKWIEGYVQPVFELARFIKNKGLKVYSPRGILTSAGTLYPSMQETIEEVFQCKVFNRYGTREVGDIACSCLEQSGLHLSLWNHYIEILDENLKPVAANQMGKIYVTTLNNFTMPLIRYDIGDLGLAPDHSEKYCTCGRNTPLIKKIEGREMSVFRTQDGNIIPAEFFIHFVGVVHNKGYISRLQVIQEAYDLIRLKVVIQNEKEFNLHKEEIVNSIRKVMGPGCKVEFEAVENISPLENGKFLYTISKVK